MLRMFIKYKIYSNLHNYFSIMVKFCKRYYFHRQVLCNQTMTSITITMLQYCASVELSLIVCYFLNF